MGRVDNRLRSVEPLRARDLEPFIPLGDRAGFPGPVGAFAMRLVKCWTYRWCWIYFLHILSGVENGDWKSQVWVCWAAGWPNKASRTSPRVQSGKGMSSLLTICIELILIFCI